MVGRDRLPGNDTWIVMRQEQRELSRRLARELLRLRFRVGEAVAVDDHLMRAIMGMFGAIMSMFGRSRRG